MAPIFKPGGQNAEGIAMAAIDTALRTGLAVLGPDGRVVVVLLGADAPDAAEEWQAEGYTVQPVAVPED
jgi:hypothetical protein